MNIGNVTIGKGCSLKEAEAAWNDSRSKLIWCSGFKKRGQSAIRQREYTKCNTPSEMRKLYANAKHGKRKEAFSNVRARDDFMWDLKKGLLTVEIPNFRPAEHFFESFHKLSSRNQELLSSDSTNHCLSTNVPVENPPIQYQSRYKIFSVKGEKGPVEPSVRVSEEGGRAEPEHAPSKKAGSCATTRPGEVDQVHSSEIVKRSCGPDVKGFSTPTKNAVKSRKKRARRGDRGTSGAWANIFDPFAVSSQDSSKKARYSAHCTDPETSLAVISKPGFFYDSRWLLANGPASPPTKPNPVLLP